jgi:hypothetical protein
LEEMAAGGSGIVIVKELNKASGSWPLRAQFRSQKQGTWPQLTFNLDYLVVAGGGGGADFGGGGGAGGYRTSFPGGTKLEILGSGSFPVVIGAGGAGAVVGVSAAVSGSDSIFSTITSTGGGRGGSFSYIVQSGGSGGGGAGGTPFQILEQDQEEQEILLPYLLLKEIMVEQE